jgi:arylsulfatase
VAPHPVGEDVWELYHADSDFSLSTNVAKENPAKLKEMQDLFLSEAVKYHVLPIDDRSIERFDASLAGRPDLMGGRTSLTVYPGMHGIMENAFINVKNRSVDITAEIEVPKGGGDGVILAQGGQFGGWSIYVKNNRPVYYYNYLGLERMSVRATEPLPSGKVTLRYAFLYDGGRPGAGGTLMIYVNGKKVGSGKIAKTQPYVFSMDDATDVGMDEGTPVSTEYGKWDNGYRGTIKSVTVKTSAVALTAEQVKALEQLEDDDAVSID